MNVTLEDAYREACLALGESVVRERLLSAELARLALEQPACRTCGKPMGNGEACDHPTS